MRAITCITADGSWDYYPFAEYDVNIITHWMPLPESPELKEKL